MAYFKAFIHIFVISLVVSTILARTLTEGEKSDEDKLLYRRFVKAPAVPFRKVVRQIVFPEKGEAAKEIINFVNATDLSKPNSKKGGRVKISTGGVGSPFIVLDIVSSLGRGLDFDIKLYGK